jgi:glutathione S-transferase
MMTLYDIGNSGNCHKARLMLSLLGIEHELKAVDYLAGALRTPEFLALNPLGQVPVLADGDVILHDSQAICIYLAKRYGNGRFLPEDAADLGRVLQWVSFAANELAHSTSRARGIVAGRARGDLKAYQALGHRALGVLDAHLAGRQWLETAEPTVGDIVCYPYSKAAPEGGVVLDAYDNLRAWHARIEALPGFLAF